MTKTERAKQNAIDQIEHYEKQIYALHERMNCLEDEVDRYRQKIRAYQLKFNIGPPPPRPFIPNDFPPTQGL